MCHVGDISCDSLASRGSGKRQSREQRLENEGLRTGHMRDWKPDLKESRAGACQGKGQVMRNQEPGHLRIRVRSYKINSQVMRDQEPDHAISRAKSRTFTGSVIQHQEPNLLRLGQGLFQMKRTALQPSQPPPYHGPSALCDLCG